MENENKTFSGSQTVMVNPDRQARTESLTAKVIENDGRVCISSTDLPAGIKAITSEFDAIKEHLDYDQLTQCLNMFTEMRDALLEAVK